MASDDIWKYYVFAIKATADIFGTIFVPAAVAVFIEYHIAMPSTVFLFVLLSTLLLSLVGLLFKVMVYGKAFQKLNGEDESRGPGG